MIPLSVLMPDAGFRLDLNANARSQILRLGHEASNVVVVDDLLNNAENLRDLACALPFVAPRVNQYPGLNAAVPEGLSDALLTFLLPTLRQAFGISPQANLATNSYFGLVCAPEGSLLPSQRLPHIDATQFGIALLLYLCQPEHGGTGFFRHTATGFETVTDDRRLVYQSVVHNELTRGLPPEGYLTESVPGFELIGKSEAVFNRLIAYRVNQLHSGLVNPTYLSADPRQGRITLNVFVAVRG